MATWTGRPGRAGGMPLDQWRNTANGKRWFAGQAQRQRAAGQRSDRQYTEDYWKTLMGRAQESADTGLARIGEQEAQGLARLNEQEQFALSQQDPWNRVEQSVNENAANRGILRSGMANQNLSDAANRWGAQRAGISRPIAQARQEMLGTNAWNRGQITNSLAGLGRERGPALGMMYQDRQLARQGRLDTLRGQARGYNLDEFRTLAGLGLAEDELSAEHPAYRRPTLGNSWESDYQGDPSPAAREWNKNKKNVKSPKGEATKRTLANQEAYAALAAQKFAWDKQVQSIPYQKELAKAQAEAQAELAATQNAQKFGSWAAATVPTFAGATPESLGAINSVAAAMGLSPQEAQGYLSSPWQRSLREFSANQGPWSPTATLAAAPAGPLGFAPQPVGQSGGDYLSNWWLNAQQPAWQGTMPGKVEQVWKWLTQPKRPW